MASLLLVAIPFIAALGAQAREGAKDVKHRSAILALAGGGLVVVILGLALNGSLAGYGLGVPVVLASLLMLLAPSRRVARGGMIAIALAGLVALGLIWNNPVSDRIGPSAEASVTTRQTILANSARLIGQYFPVGSGLGTFESVYAMEEDPAKVDRYRINHAHSDYVELAVETGLAGIILMLLFLAWWVHSVWRMLRSPAVDQYALAGAIASAAILLHSAVDFPLRTAAIGALFAMCMVLIVQSRRTAKSEGDLRPVRHLSVG
jgi:O-antigen ligase